MWKWLKTHTLSRRDSGGCEGLGEAQYWWCCNYCGSVVSEGDANQLVDCYDAKVCEKLTYATSCCLYFSFMWC